MKRYILLLPIILSACASNPTSPAGLLAPIPNLIVTDTLDFGFIPVGASKQLSIQFENIGPDTITIFQSLSKSANFSFDNPQSYLPSFWIAPGRKIPITIHCTGTDTFAHMEFDTIRSGNNRDIVVLRSAWRFFSSMFPTGPRSLDLSLTGLIGRDSISSKSANYDFNFSVDSGLLQWGDTLLFHGTVDNSYRSPGGIGGAIDDLLQTNIWLHIDTVRHTIDWLKAQSYYDHADLYGRSRIESKRWEYLELHGMLLTLNGAVWSVTSKAGTLPSIVGTAEYRTEYWNSENLAHIYTALKSIVGYDTSSTLSISIH